MERGIVTDLTSTIWFKSFNGFKKQQLMIPPGCNWHERSLQGYFVTTSRNLFRPDTMLRMSTIQASVEITERKCKQKHFVKVYHIFIK